VARKIDPDQLIDPTEAAEILGLSSGNGVAVYRKRYSDFPAPVVVKGRCVLWLRQDIEAWAQASGRRR
jgi:predicted DNA-binding transcriptional regulator AlpA